MKLTSADTDPSDDTVNNLNLPKNGKPEMADTADQSAVKDPAELKSTNGANGHDEEIESEPVNPESNGLDNDVEMTDQTDKEEKTDSTGESTLKENGSDVIQNGNEVEKSEKASDVVDSAEGGSKGKIEAAESKDVPVESDEKMSDESDGDKTECAKKVGEESNETSQISITVHDAVVATSDAKVAASDNDLEKLKSDRGLKMQLDDGETFEVQMISSGDESSGDDDSSSASSRPPSATPTTATAGDKKPGPKVAVISSASVVPAKPDFSSSVTKITIPSSGATTLRTVAGNVLHQPTILAHSQVYRDAKGNIVRKPIPVVKSSSGIVNLQPIIIQSQPAQQPKLSGPTNEELAIEFNKNSRKKLTINNLIDALKEFGLDLDYLKESDDKSQDLDKKTDKKTEKSDAKEDECAKSDDSKKSESAEKKSGDTEKKSDDSEKKSDDSEKTVGKDEKVEEKSKGDEDDEVPEKATTKSRSAPESPRRSTRRSSRTADKDEKMDVGEPDAETEEKKTKSEESSSGEGKAVEKESESEVEVKKESKEENEVKEENKEVKVESEKVKKEVSEKAKVEPKDENKSAPGEEKEKESVKSETKSSKPEPKIEEVVIDSDDEKDKQKKEEEEEDKDEDIASHGDVAKKLRPVAKFLYFTGLDFSRESVYHDLVHAQDKKHKAGKLDAVEIHDFQQMRKVYHRLRHKNSYLRPKHGRVCKRCSFSTESKSALYLHQQQGHLDDRKVVWSCALCEFEARIVQAFVFHMEAEHNMTAQPLPRPQFFCCHLCTYNSSTKSHMTKHTAKCEKQFVPEKHQFPLYDDINFIFRALPGPLIKVPVPQPPPQKLPQVRQVVPQAAVNRFVAQPKMLPIVPRSGYTRLQGAQMPQMRPAPTVTSFIQPGRNRYPPQTAQQFITSTIQQMKIVPTPKSQSTPIVIKDGPPSTPQLQQGVKRPATVATLTSTGGPQKAKSAKYSYEVCEICGGFVLDRQALRLHFAMAHNINLREDALDVSRTPPLSCDFCTSRFFTFQGLSLHKARSNHARADQALCHICNTLTSDMPQHIKNAHNIVPNQLNTIRICPICGQCVLTEKTEAHIERVHNIKLDKPVSMGAKPVYGCNQCSAQFTERSLLNLHIRKGHPGTAPPAEGKKCPLCGAMINAGGYNKHVLVAHCTKKLKVKLTRCDTDGDDEDEDGDGDATESVEATAAGDESAVGETNTENAESQ